MQKYYLKIYKHLHVAQCNAAVQECQINGIRHPDRMGRHPKSSSLTPEAAHALHRACMHGATEQARPGAEQTPSSPCGLGDAYASRVTYSKQPHPTYSRAHLGPASQPEVLSLGHMAPLQGLCLQVQNVPRAVWHSTAPGPPTQLPTPCHRTCHWSAELQRPQAPTADVWPGTGRWKGAQACPEGHENESRAGCP